MFGELLNVQYASIIAYILNITSLVFLTKASKIHQHQIFAVPEVKLSVSLLSLPKLRLGVSLPSNQVHQLIKEEIHFLCAWYTIS
jgi:hypothetical protein